MSNVPLPRRHEEPNTGAEAVPPGATEKAEHRPHNPPAHGPNDDAETERTIDDPRGGEGYRGGGDDWQSKAGPEGLTREQVDAMPGPVVLEFGSSTCPHCIALEGPLLALLSKFPGVKHLKVEDGKGQPLGRSFRVKLWPTLVFLHNGHVVRQLARPEVDDVRDALNALATDAG